MIKNLVMISAIAFGLLYVIQHGTSLNGPSAKRDYTVVDSR